MSRARFDNIVAVGVVACLLLAAAAYGLAQLLWLRGAAAGMDGAFAREIDPAGAPRVEAAALRTGLAALDGSRRLGQAGLALAALALAGTIVAALRTYREWRRWHWLAFAAAGPALVAGWFALSRLLFRTGRADIWIPVGLAAALASGLDLRRAGSSAPGRLVAWCVLALSVLAVVVFVAT